MPVYPGPVLPPLPKGAEAIRMLDGGIKAGAFSPEARWVAYEDWDGNLFIVTPTEKVSTEIPDDITEDFAVSPDGKTVVVQKNECTVHIILENGTIVHQKIDEGTLRYSGAFDPQGNYHFFDRNPPDMNRFQVMNPRGVLSAKATSYRGYPRYMDVAADGRMAVAAYFDNVTTFNADGKKLASFNVMNARTASFHEEALLALKRDGEVVELIPGKPEKLHFFAFRRLTTPEKSRYFEAAEFGRNYVFIVHTEVRGTGTYHENKTVSGIERHEIMQHIGDFLRVFDYEGTLLREVSVGQNIRAWKIIKDKLHVLAGDYENEKVYWFTVPAKKG
jgi:hypothetical protein